MAGFVQLVSARAGAKSCARMRSILLGRLALQVCSTETLTPARAGSSPAIPAMMMRQFRCSIEKTRKAEISRDFSAFFDSEVFRNFVDAFRAFRVCRQIRTSETVENSIFDDIMIP